MIETKQVKEKIDEELHELAEMKDYPEERPAAFPFRLVLIYLAIAGVLGLAILFLLGIA